MRDSEERTVGLFASLRALSATLVGIAHTRLELISTELQEEMVRVASLLMWGFFALFFVSLGITFAAFAVVVGFWETHRLLAVSLLALLFLLLAGGALIAIAKLVRTRPRLFAASLGELAKDRDQLSGES